MLHDLRTAFRSVRRAPAFSALVIAILALGIGGSAAIFSLVNALVLRPLPFEEASRLVRMRDEVSRPGEGSWRYNTSPRSFVSLRDRAEVFDGVVAQRHRPMTLTSPGEPERVIGIGVSAGWSDVLGVGPVLGRPFSAEEEALGLDAGVVLLGWALWQDRFGGDPEVLGRSLRLDGGVHTVVGVMPRRYNFPYGAQLWLPERFDPDDTAAGPYVVGRLRDGLDLEGAQVRLDELSARVAEAYPESHASVRLLAVSFRDDLVSNHPRLGITLLLGAGVLLLLACVNIANLMVVRGTERQSEIAVRAAMGAPAGRQARELLVESLVLGGIGGAAGLGVASAMSGVMAHLSMEPDSSLGAFFTDVGLDLRVAAFTLAVAVGTAILFGVVPAWRAARTQPREVLAATGRAGGRRGRLLDGLVVLEVAVALVLLAGSTLMVRNFMALRDQDPGYRTEGLHTFELGLPASRFQEDSARVRFMGRLLDRLAAEPAVRSAGATQHLPFDDGSSSASYSVEGGPATEADRRLLASFRVVAGDYFPTMGIPLLQGRSFDPVEGREVRDVVVVNRAFAERYWAGDAIGRRLKLGPASGDAPWLTVVGVVADADENQELRETLYLPYPQAPAREMAMVVELAGGVDALRRVVRELDPDQPLGRLATIEARLDRVLGAQRAATRLMAGFGAFGLVLAVLGIHGVLAHTVARRRRELAVRQAVGLTRAGALGMVIRRTLLLTAGGLVIGLPVALAFSRLLVDVLGGGARDVALDIRLAAEQAGVGPAAWSGLVLAITVAAILAALAPARRAAATDPATELRA
jgi:putative ABC transport system permease protein